MDLPYEIFVNIMDHAHPADIVAYQIAYPDDDKAYDNRLWYRAYKYQYVIGDITYDTHINYYNKYYTISNIDSIIDIFIKDYREYGNGISIGAHLINLTKLDKINSSQHIHICEYFYIINLPFELYGIYGRIDYNSKRYKSVQDAVNDISNFQRAVILEPGISDSLLRPIQHAINLSIDIAKKIGLDIVSNDKEFIIREMINHLKLTHRLFIFPTSYSRLLKNGVQYYRYR